MISWGSKKKRSLRTRSNKKDSEDELLEDEYGWHVHSEMGCFGCESGIDCPGAHCSACNIQLGLY